MTMWAIATGNSYLEGLGRLQTGVLTRSIKEYFLIKDGNTNHPPDFARNKVMTVQFRHLVFLLSDASRLVGKCGVKHRHLTTHVVRVPL